MLLKCCTHYASEFGKLSSGHRTGKGQCSFQSQRKAMPKMLNYGTIAFVSHASKVMFKILQARLQQYVNHELPDVQAGFRKGRETRDQIANIRWIIEKARKFKKTIYFCFIEYTKAFDCMDHNKLENFSRDRNQFSSVSQSCLTLCDPMNCSRPGLPVHHQLPEFTQDSCLLSR